MYSNKTYCRIWLTVLSRACATRSRFAGVLGLDNLDYAASVLDMARSHGKSRLSTGGGSTLDNHGRDGIIDTSGGDGGEAGGRQRSAILSGASLRRQGSMSKATRLSGPRRAGQAAYGRLRLSVSPQDLRKMMDIINAGRRR